MSRPQSQRQCQTVALLSAFRRPHKQFAQAGALQVARQRFDLGGSAVNPDPQFTWPGPEQPTDLPQYTEDAQPGRPQPPQGARRQLQPHLNSGARRS